MGGQTVSDSLDNYNIMPVSSSISTTTTDTKTIREKKGSRRWLLLLLSFFFLSSVHAAFISYNCGYVAMTQLSTSPYYNASSFEEERGSIDWSSKNLSMADRRFDLTTTQKGWSFGGGFAGSVLGVPIFNILLSKFGTHRTMAGMGIGLSLAAFLIPITFSTSFYAFVCLRFLSGTSLAVLYAAAGDVVSRWAPSNERGLWIAVLSGHVEFSPLLSMPHAGFVGSIISWPAIYYSHAIVCGLLTVCWIIFYRDDPRKFKFLSQTELSMIQEGKNVLNKGEKKIAPPLLEIAKTPVVIAVWIACIGYYYSVQFSITFSLMYYSGALHYAPMKCGLVTMIPLFVLLVIKFSVGHISDKMTSIPERLRIKLFNSIAFVGAALFFLIASFRQPDGSFLDILCVVLPICTLGFHSAGFPKCVVLVSKQYSATVFSYMQAFGGGALVAGSFMVPALTPGETHAEWCIVFRLYAMILLVCNLVFVCFATDQPCEWTKVHPIAEPNKKIDESV